MRCQRLGDLIRQMRMTVNCLSNFDGNVASGVSSRREKIRVNNNVIRASLDQLSYAFINIRCSNLKECSDDERKAAALANASGHLAHVSVSFFATAPMAHHKDRLSKVRHGLTSNWRTRATLPNSNFDGRCTKSF